MFDWGIENPYLNILFIGDNRHEKLISRNTREDNVKPKDYLSKRPTPSLSPEPPLTKRQKRRLRGKK